MDIDRLAARHESVDRRVIEEDDVDIVGFQTGSFDQRGGNLFEESLRLGVAQDRLGSDGLRREHGGGKHGEQAGNQTHWRGA